MMDGGGFFSDLNDCTKGLFSFILCHIYIVIKIILIAITIIGIPFLLFYIPYSVFKLIGIYFTAILKIIKNMLGFIVGGDSSMKNSKFPMLDLIKEIKKTYEISKYKEDRKLGDRMYSKLIRLIIKSNVRTNMLEKIEREILEDSSLSRDYKRRYDIKLKKNHIGP